MMQPRSERTASRSDVCRSSRSIRANSAALKRELQQEAKARRTLGPMYAKEVRYRERSTVERVNGRLKDKFGALQVRVRGHSKVLCHLMFGVLALTVDQLLRLVN